MKPSDLEYSNLVKLIKPYGSKGRNESATFLNWFLENIYRLDDVAADDAICDESNDKGIDGIYVDEINEEIQLIQTKVRQKAGATMGDTALKMLAASAEQFSTPAKIDAILASSANKELKDILIKRNVSEKIKDGYSIIPIFVTNQDKDYNTEEYLKLNDKMRVYDRAAIAESFVEIDAEVGVSGKFTFTIDQTPLEFPVSDIARIFIFPVSAIELVTLQGIGDGTLFSRNVRLNLGATKVNKDIARSIEEKKEHIKFPLYHNGVTVICSDVDFDKKIG